MKPEGGQIRALMEERFERSRKLKSFQRKKWRESGFILFSGETVVVGIYAEAVRRVTRATLIRAKWSVQRNYHVS